MLRVLGEGAFGIVHLAEQETPIRRQLAIKVLRPGAGDRTTLRRFAAERQLLAGFNHPAIANVIDAGELPDGRPWFAMEYVAGEPITKYCDDHHLGVDARLRLFLELCLGVAHAHARDIVHRDLKPANVLVATVDGRPRPKIIDFGIAKALRATDEAAPEATATGRVVGTPGYMSPEQQNGDSRHVDARSDVFALGVMLFELLAGTLPWPRGAATTHDPPKPSSRLSTDPGRDTIAATRATEPRSLVHRLRGELDWIALQALHPDPAHRYADARALADDVAAHLDDRPLQARPPSWRQRVTRQARRHRLAILGGTALVVVGALVTVALTLSAAARASASERVTAIADAVDRLMQHANDPRLADVPDADRLREAAMRDAATLLQRLDSEPPTDPRMRAQQARVRCALADLMHAHGRHRDAIVLAQRAADEVDALLALPDPAPELERTGGHARQALATNRFELHEVDAALTAAEAAIAAFESWRRDHPGDSARQFASAVAMRANCLLARKDFDGAVASFRRSIEILAQRLQRAAGRHGGATQPHADGLWPRRLLLAARRQGRSGRGQRRAVGGVGGDAGCHRRRPRVRAPPRRRFVPSRSPTRPCSGAMASVCVACRGGITASTAAHPPLGPRTRRQHRARGPSPRPGRARRSRRHGRSRDAVRGRGEGTSRRDGRSATRTVPPGSRCTRSPTSASNGTPR